MMRSEIHADGTVYAYQPRVGYAVPARVVETGRFWTLCRSYTGPDKVTMEGRNTPSRTSDPTTVRRYDGFLIVALKTADDPGNLRILSEMELKAPENSEDMKGWPLALPEGLQMHIVVSRDLVAPWPLYVVERDRKRVEEQRAREQREMTYRREHAAKAEARKTMARFGLTESHAPAPGRATVQVDAEQLTALLRRFEAEAPGL